MLVAPSARDDEQREKRKNSEQRELRFFIEHASSSGGTVGAECEANHLHSLKFSIAPMPKLVAEFLSNGWARTIAWERTDVSEDLGASVRRRDEAKASIIVPTAKGASELHCET